MLKRESLGRFPVLTCDAAGVQNLRQSNDVGVMLDFVTRASDNDRNSIITLTKVRLVKKFMLRMQRAAHRNDLLDAKNSEHFVESAKPQDTRVKRQASS